MSESSGTAPRMVAIELEPAPERKSAGEPHAIVGRRISQEALKRLHDRIFFCAANVDANDVRKKRFIFT